MSVTEHQSSILRHALGFDDFGGRRCERNHFVTGPVGQDHADCEALVSLLLMSKDERFPNELSGGSDVFRVTELGESVMRQSFKKKPRLTRGQARYAEWLESGAGDCGVTFGEWLKNYV